MKHSCLIFLMLITAFNVRAKQVDSYGIVNMQGSIVDTTCSLDFQSKDQTIEMKTLSVNKMKRDGEGPKHNITLKLINCKLIEEFGEERYWKPFKVSFEGDVDHHNFGVEGEAEGVALQILDSNNQEITPGKVSDSKEWDVNDKLLIYSIRLINNNQPIKAGDYHSTIRFKVDYS